MPDVQLPDTTLPAHRISRPARAPRDLFSRLKQISYPVAGAIVRTDMPSTPEQSGRARLDAAKARRILPS